MLGKTGVPVNVVLQISLGSIQRRIDLLPHHCLRCAGDGWVEGSRGVKGDAWEGAPTCRPRGQGHPFGGQLGLAPPLETGPQTQESDDVKGAGLRLALSGPEGVL